MSVYLQASAQDAAYAPAGYSILKDGAAPAIKRDAIPGSADYRPAPHPSHLKTDVGADEAASKPIYTTEYAESIVPSHRPPKGVCTMLSCCVAVQAGPFCRCNAPPCTFCKPGLL